MPKGICFFYDKEENRTLREQKALKKVAGGKFFSFLMRSPAPKPKGLGGQATKVCEAKFFLLISTTSRRAKWLAAFLFKNTALLYQLPLLFFKKHQFRFHFCYFLVQICLIITVWRSKIFLYGCTL